VYACIAEIHKKTQNYIFFRVRFRKKIFRFIYIIEESGYHLRKGMPVEVCWKKSRKQEKIIFLKLTEEI